MTEKKIIYFGYGANAHKDMIKALIGRAPSGFKAKLKNYSLYIQSWSSIPLEAKKILEVVWDKNFSSYIAIPKKNGVVWGTAWRMTKKEREIIGEWELHPKWFIPIKVKVIDEDGNAHEAETEIIPQSYTRKKAIIEKEYSYFPNNKRKMLKLAKEVRKEYLKKDKKK